MTHKTHPYSNRLGIIKDWKSRWFNLKDYPIHAEQDFVIRKYFSQKFKNAGIESIELERFAQSLSIIIYTSRPGIMIGRGGSGLEEIKRDIVSLLLKTYNLSREAKKKDRPAPKFGEIRFEIREVRDIEKHAQLVAANVAEQLERRMPFRRVIKRMLDRTMTNKDVQGAKILIKGRLGGADMARTQFVKEGKLPLQTLRADIDYAQVNAITTYGVIGVKVWIYRGEKFD